MADYKTFRSENGVEEYLVNTSVEICFSVVLMDYRSAQVSSMTRCQRIGTIPVGVEVTDFTDAVFINLNSTSMVDDRSRL